MPVVIVDIGLAIVTAALGMLGGWWLRGGGLRGETAPNDQDGRVNRDILSKLYDLAAQVAADVGQHNSRVEEISEELAAAKAPESDVVVSAVTRLIHNNQQMQVQLSDAQERLRQQAQRLESSAAEARTDPLTGLANRRGFDEETALRHQVYNVTGEDVSLVLIDVDHFKRFNDTHGHQAGDRVLQGLGGVYQRQARQTDVVARYGGEEFAVILPDTGGSEAAQVAERIRESVRQSTFRHAGTEMKVTISCGTAQLTRGEDVAAWIRRADEALYASKQAGRNCTSIHEIQEIRTLRGEQPTPPAAPRVPEVHLPEIPAGLPSAAATDEEPRPTQQSCNKATFCMVLGRRLAECRRGGPPLSVLLLHVDNYTEIRGNYGQQACDLAMRITMQFLNASFREMDLVACYEESTFAGLLPNCKLADAVCVAERLRQAIARCKFPVAGDRFHFTVSIAGAEATLEDDTDRLLRRAQDAMDAAVKTGGNCTYLHNGQKPEAGTPAATQTAETR